MDKYRHTVFVAIPDGRSLMGFSTAIMFYCSAVLSHISMKHRPPRLKDHSGITSSYTDTPVTDTPPQTPQSKQRCPDQNTHLIMINHGNDRSNYDDHEVDCGITGDRKTDGDKNLGRGKRLSPLLKFLEDLSDEGWIDQQSVTGSCASAFSFTLGDDTMTDDHLTVDLVWSDAHEALQISVSMDTNIPTEASQENPEHFKRAPSPRAQIQRVVTAANADTHTGVFTINDDALILRSGIDNPEHLNTNDIRAQILAMAIDITTWHSTVMRVLGVGVNDHTTSLANTHTVPSATTTSLIDLSSHTTQSPQEIHHHEYESSPSSNSIIWH